jgi:hypothetical protein
MITQGATAAGFSKVWGRGMRPTELLLLAEKDLRRQFDPLPRRQRRREVEPKEAFESLPDNRDAIAIFGVKPLAKTDTERLACSLIPDPWH